MSFGAADRGTSPREKGLSRAPHRMAPADIRDAGSELPAGVADPYDVSDRTIVPDQLSYRMNPNSQITESAFLWELSTLLESRIAALIDLPARPGGGRMAVDVLRLLTVLRRSIVGPDQLADPLDPWLRARLDLGEAVLPADYFDAFLNIFDAAAASSSLQLGLSRRVEQLSETEAALRHSGEGEGDIDLRHESTVPTTMQLAAAGLMPPPPGAMTPTSDDGRRVHLIIQQHYLADHARHMIMMENRVVWPGGGGSIQTVGLGTRGADELAKVRFALMTKRGLTKLPDILDVTSKEVYEIKPISQVREGLTQLYDNYLNPLQQAGLPYRPGDRWRASPTYAAEDKLAIVQQIPGLIAYYLVPLVPVPLVPVPDPSRLRLPSLQTIRRWAPVFALAAATVILAMSPVPGDEVAAAAALARALAAARSP